MDSRLLKGISKKRQTLAHWNHRMPSVAEPRAPVRISLARYWQGLWDAQEAEVIEIFNWKRQLIFKEFKETSLVPGHISTCSLSYTKRDHGLWGQISLFWERLWFLGGNPMLMRSAAEHWGWSRTVSAIVLLGLASFTTFCSCSKRCSNCKTLHTLRGTFNLMKTSF